MSFETREVAHAVTIVLVEHCSRCRRMSSEIDQEEIDRFDAGLKNMAEGQALGLMKYLKAQLRAACDGIELSNTANRADVAAAAHAWADTVQLKIMLLALRCRVPIGGANER